CKPPADILDMIIHTKDFEMDQNRGRFLTFRTCQIRFHTFRCCDPLRNNFHDCLPDMVAGLSLCPWNYSAWILLGLSPGCNTGALFALRSENALPWLFTRNTQARRYEL